MLIKDHVIVNDQPYDYQSADVSVWHEWRFDVYLRNIIYSFNRIVLQEVIYGYR